MDKRKELILEVAIEDYIDTGAAVSSKGILNSRDFDVSSATIRNELSCLEREGFLSSLHTSSGRVPTDKGYRFYVDKFLDGNSLNENSRNLLLNAYDDLSDDIDIVLKKTTEVLSELTSCCSLVIAPDFSRTIIKMIKVVLINVYKIMVLVHTAGGEAKDVFFETDNALDDDSVRKISIMLQNAIQDKSIEELICCDVEDLIGYMGQYRELLEKTLSSLIDVGKNMSNHTDIYKTGTSKLMEYDDLSDISELKGIVEVLEHEKSLLNVLNTNESRQKDVSFLIGSESNDKRMAGCSVAEADFSQNGVEGRIVLVGPKRIRYDEVKKILSEAKNAVEERFIKRGN